MSRNCDSVIVKSYLFIPCPIQDWAILWKALQQQKAFILSQNDCHQYMQQFLGSHFAQAAAAPQHCHGSWVHWAKVRQWKRQREDGGVGC